VFYIVYFIRHQIIQASECQVGLIVLSVKDLEFGYWFLNSEQSNYSTHFLDQVALGFLRGNIYLVVILYTVTAVNFSKMYWHRVLMSHGRKFEIYTFRLQ
jgi:hypothetical protein